MTRPGGPVRTISPNVVHPLVARAAAWYRRVGFAPFPAHPTHLMIRLKDIRTSLQCEKADISGIARPPTPGECPSRPVLYGRVARKLL